MITKLLSQKLVLLVIGLAAGSGILIPASYGSFHPVTSSEIADGTIQSVDIGDGQVKTADIGTDQVKAAEIAANAVGESEIAANSVGASELLGVSKLKFASCAKTFSDSDGPGEPALISCNVSGAEEGDKVIATMNAGQNCFGITAAKVGTSDRIDITMRNMCTFSAVAGAVTLSIIVYNTEIIIIPPP